MAKNNNQKEQWEKLVCSCKKEWLDDNTHYASCPVFQVQKAIAQAKEEGFREGLKRAQIVAHEVVCEYPNKSIQERGSAWQELVVARDKIYNRLKKLIEE